VELNNLALYLRKLDRLAEAEQLLRRAVAIEETARGETSPKMPHRLNNLCTVLVMQDKLDDAKRLVERAWSLRSGQHDLTSARLIFVRLSIAMLESRPLTPFVGMLRTLLGWESLPDYADVVRVWDIGYFIERLRPRLPPGSAEFLTTLAAALNDHQELTKLEEIDLWNGHPAISLEAPWPEA
jgi:hypothetical protein